MDVRDRVIGCVLGLALGDALGAPFEFMRSSEIPRPLPAFERSWQGLPPGTTTDDTAMARNLVRSLVERGSFDPEDLVARHLSWFRSGPPDVGNLTRRVLQRVSEGRAAEEAAEAIWRVRGPEVSAGNGSVMYCAPLGAAYTGRSDELHRLAPKLSALTHYDHRCRTAVVAVTLAAAATVRGTDPAGAVSESLVAVAALEGGEEIEFLVEAVGDVRAIDGPDQGFCLYAAAAGLQALARGGTFEEELRRIVALGGDTDTNAAVAGALVGAAAGRGGLPEDWLARLPDRAVIEEEAVQLAMVAESLSGIG
jgi:ADP-ribosyl-[dinitrogen reductase] hydrolase